MSKIDPGRFLDGDIYELLGMTHNRNKYRQMLPRKLGTGANRRLKHQVKRNRRLKRITSGRTSNSIVDNKFPKLLTAVAIDLIIGKNNGQI